MSPSQQNPELCAPSLAQTAVSPAESVLYMGDLLENMRKIAQAHGLGVLAHLLELARVETRMVARDLSGPQATHG